MGVFQIESRAQMQSLRRTRPETLDDLTIQVAIVRPGPILGGAVNPYISRRQAMREDPDFVVPYDHPSLEPVLADTLGTIIFQDQVIEVAMAFGGFSPGEAEGLRRAMSRKRSEAAIEAYHERFIEGAARTHGVDAETAERVYEMIVGFSGFGFPKAHGAAFGLLAYQSTWLRVHYAPEFLCALLNEQPMGFYAPDTLAHEAQRKGIELIAPDVNLSGEECEVDADGRIRLGLNYVLGARSGRGRGAGRRARGGRAVPLAGRPRLARRGGARGARPARLGRRVRLAGRGGGGRRRGGAGAADRAVAARRRGARHRGGRRRHAARAAARAARLAGPEGAARLGRDDRRLRDDGPHARHAPRRAAAARRCPPGRSRRATSRRCAHETPVVIGGLVIARQRPGTAKGIVFLLLEDEFGTINLDRPARRLRAPPALRPLRAAAARPRPPGEAADRGRGAQRLRARPAAARRAGRGGRDGRRAARARGRGRSSPRWRSAVPPCRRRRSARSRTSAGSRPPCRASPRGGGDEARPRRRRTRSAPCRAPDRRSGRGLRHPA